MRTIGSLPSRAERTCSRASSFASALEAASGRSRSSDATDPHSSASGTRRSRSSARGTPSRAPAPPTLNTAPMSSRRLAGAQEERPCRRTGHDALLLPQVDDQVQVASRHAELGVADRRFAAIQPNEMDEFLQLTMRSPIDQHKPRYRPSAAPFARRRRSPPGDAQRRTRASAPRDERASQTTFGRRSLGTSSDCTG
jgi:hypothetical protein